MPVRRQRPAQARLTVRFAAAAFFLIFLLVELAAFNTGENLLYLLASVTLGLLAVAILVSRANVHAIELVREIPDSTHRDEPFTVGITIANRKRFISAYSLVVTFEKEEWRPAAHIASIPSNASVTLRLERVMRRRGVHSLPPIRLMCSYPMGFYRRELTFRDDRTIVVFPRIYPIPRSVLERLDDSGNRPRPTLMPGDEFYALREYIPGDDIRYICWRVSARLGELIVRELEPGSARSVVIVLDTRGKPDTAELEEKFEKAIDLAASLALAFIERQYSVALVTPQQALPLGQGESHMLRVLDLLARVEPAQYGDFGDDWFRAHGDLGTAAKIVLATDPSQWGGRGLDGSARVADPEEVLYAG
jgi:uncharacterized protein (DUF58 family)